MILCVTGPLAAGKNAVCRLLEAYGFISLDADKAVHAAIETSAEQILAAFSAEAFSQHLSLQNEDGSINRRALGKLLFKKKELLSVQEKIVYPAVIAEAKRFIAEDAGRRGEKSRIILNATVLYKTPELLRLCSRILYVDAPKIIRLVRAVRRDRLPPGQILSRFRAQKTLFTEYKKTGVPIIRIKNAGSLKNLEAAIKAISALR